MPEIRLGQRSLVAFIDCNPRKLSSKESLDAVVEAARLMGAKIISSNYAQLSPIAYSYAVILAESHLIIHANTMERWALANIFTCGKMDPTRGYEFLAKHFEAKWYTAEPLQPVMAKVQKCRRK